MSSRRRSLLTKGGIAAVAGLVLLQLFPAGRLGLHVEEIGRNPPERFVIDAPAEVLAIMRRACWDCHSNETRWRLYARVAPVSWLLARDIHIARNHLNFSTWGEADEGERRTDRESCWTQIESGAMPPWYYVYPMHLDARLSDADRRALRSWLMKEADGDEVAGEGAKSGKSAKSAKSGNSAEREEREEGAEGDERVEPVSVFAAAACRALAARPCRDTRVSHRAPVRVTGE